MYSYTETAFLAVLTEFGLPAAHVVAQSQAAPGVVKLGISHTASVRNVVLYAPLGFAATTFGNTSEERLQTLARRARQSLMQRSQLPIYDPRNLYAGFAILRAITREVERGASKRKYAKGLSYDMREDCKTLVKKLKAQGTTVTLLLGDQDKIFTVDDIQPALKEAGITDMHIHVLPDISHLSLAVRAGKRVLQVATDIARAAKASR